MKARLSLFAMLFMKWSFALFATAISVNIFVHLLMQVVELFKEYWQILIWAAVPVALFSVWFKNRPYFKDAEVHITPPLAPLTFVSTLFAHLVGVSVGRETAAVHIGSGVGEFFRRRFQIPTEQKMEFQHAIVACAFGAAFLAPVGSMLFAVEYKKHMGAKNIFMSLVGSVVGCTLGVLLHTPHWEPPTFDFVYLGLHWYSVVFVVGLALLSVAFIYTEQNIQLFFSRWSLMTRQTVTAAVLTAVTFWVGSPRYNGLGLGILNESFTSSLPLKDSLFKLGFIGLASLGGWLGGMFVPLMALGGALGNQMMSSLQSWHFEGAEPTLMATAAASGTFALISARFAIPLTCVALSGEIFGLQVLCNTIPVYCLIVLLRKLFPQIKKIIQKTTHGENLPPN